VVLFAGHLDNGAEIAAALGLPAPHAIDRQALARLYGLALLSWGEDTDRRLIGEYCTITLNPAEHSLRLARSPLRAPPLHYYCDGERVIASQAVRAIFACGVARELDDEKLADMAWFNASNEQRSWYRGLARVPLGSTVTLTPDTVTSRCYYDIAALPRLPRASRADYLVQAHALLEEGTRAALAGSQRPALMLSGGLDSSLVAVKALRVLPGQTPLNAYTFVVEPSWGKHSYPGRFADERPFVETFCAMHPRIVPHYFDNADRELGTRANDLFFATGGAQQGLANLNVYHSLWEAARADGCDRVLLGEFGNLTASADGSWAFSEYLLRLRWRQLYLGLRDAPPDDRSLPRRFLALAVLPLLPDRLWRWQRQLRRIDNHYELASPLSRAFAASSGAIRRADAVGLPNPRFPLRDRLATMREVHANAWGEFSDIYDGFSQIYGIEQRDPTAYRPFFEFCAGLPSDMFLHRGQQRWLARAMLAGSMPEAQRLTRLSGRHNADWHRKLTRQRGALLEEIERFAQVPRLAAMLDLNRARAALEDWPQSGEVDESRRLACEIALPRAIMLGRFINYVEGRNLPPAES
jgi:asparagine synthase (glutamine-hydrolysing)